MISSCSNAVCYSHISLLLLLSFKCCLAACYFEDNKKKTGSAAKTVPAFYAELHEVLSGNHMINPISTIDTLQQSTVDEDDVERDEPQQKRKKHTVSLFTSQNVPFSKPVA